MDPRRKVRIDKIFSNLESAEEGCYEIFNCEVNQSDGSLILEKEVHTSKVDEVRQEILTSPIKANYEDSLSLPPACQFSSPSHDSSSHAIQITFQADIHAPFDDTYLQPAVDRTSKTAEINSNNVKSASFIKPNHVVLHSNKQMSILNDSFNFIEVYIPKPTEHSSGTVLNCKNTPNFTDVTQTQLPEKKIDASLITIRPHTVSPKQIENASPPDITEDEVNNNRSSPSILLTSDICMDDNNLDITYLSPQPTNKQAVEYLDEIENLDEINVRKPEELDDIPRRKRSKKSDKNNWKRNTDKELRERGMQYEGKKKEEDVWVYNKIRKEKTMKPRCNCKLSSQESKFKCSSVTEEKRNAIFKRFWNSMSWNEKKIYIKTLTIVKPTERKRTEKEDSRRKQTLELYLEVDSLKIRVCKTMFLNTLAIGEWMLHNWTKQDIENETEKDETNNEQETNEKEIGTRQQREESKKAEHVKQFFNFLPKLESHYCRSQTSKLYLEPIWESKTQLLLEYNNVFAKENGYDPVSITTFSKVFQDMNLSLFRPKKDLCDICEAHKCKNVSEEKYVKHIQMKDAARMEKEADKKSEKEVLTMDLQSVLLCPKSNASALYYKTKLIVHNFTAYDIKRSEGYCFIWHGAH